jgi:hypothetical protein
MPQAPWSLAQSPALPASHHNWASFSKTQPGPVCCSTLRGQGLVLKRIPAPRPGTCWKLSLHTAQSFKLPVLFSFLLGCRTRPCCPVTLWDSPVASKEHRLWKVATEQARVLNFSANSQQEMRSLRVGSPARCHLPSGILDMASVPTSNQIIPSLYTQKPCPRLSAPALVTP